MVCCKVDNDVAGEALGWPLPPWKAILLHRTLPSCGGLVVYITFICFNFGIIYENFAAGEKQLGVIGIVLALLPAYAAMIFTLASPPPDWHNEESALAVTIEAKEIKWILWQIINAVFFPVTATARYCFQIFWSIEEVFASKYGDIERTKGALERLKAPSPVELYLLLQAFIHAAPHAVIHLVQLMRDNQTSTHDKITIQSISVVTALMRMASTATIYRRFEREKLSGRKYPWAVEQENESFLNSKALALKAESEKNREDVRVRDQHSDSKRLTELNNLDIVFRKNFDKSYSFIKHYVARESRASDFLDPISSNRDSSEESTHSKELPIWDRIAPRRSKHINIEENVNISPPQMHAPRPKSLAEWAEYVVENAESFPDRIAAPTRHRLHSIEPSESSDVLIPQRVPRNFRRGLEPQNVAALLISYFGWHLFFISRVIAMSAFLVYFPWTGMIILLAHYQLMLLLLIIPSASIVRKAFYIFLAFVYIFCLLEFKVRFRHVRVWHLFWLTLCTIETIAFTGVWMFVDDSMHFWWKNYVLLVIFGSTSLSYMCLFVYFIILKPKETIVYQTQESAGSS